MRVCEFTKTGRGVRRTLLNLAVLAAFFLQSFLVQTHLHKLLLPAEPAGGITVSAPSPAPSLPDTDSCLLCQEFIHGGVYLTPAAAAVLPPSAIVTLLPLMVSAPVSGRLISHIWMGRAPPHA